MPSVVASSTAARAIDLRAHDLDPERVRVEPVQRLHRHRGVHHTRAHGVDADAIRLEGGGHGGHEAGDGLLGQRVQRVATERDHPGDRGRHHDRAPAVGTQGRDARPGTEDDPADVGVDRPPVDVDGQVLDRAHVPVHAGVEVHGTQRRAGRADHLVPQLGVGDVARHRSAPAGLGGRRGALGVEVDGEHVEARLGEDRARGPPDARPRTGDDRGARQWRKWRSPVKTMARPSSSALAMVSSSFTEPPGWMTTATPASAAASMPSGNG